MKRFFFSTVLSTLVVLALVVGATPGRKAEAAPPGAAWNLSVYNVSANQASFSWAPSGWGVQQWVDLSFWNGSYWQWQNAGPLGTWASSYTWSGLQPNVTYYARINTGTIYGQWIASDWASFVTPGIINPCGGMFSYLNPYSFGLSIVGCPGSPLRIWVERGEGATYRVNESIRVCYAVPAPMYIQIIDTLANGVSQTFLAGYDDGRGDCLPGYVTPPPGLERLTIYANGTSASTYFYVNY